MNLIDAGSIEQLARLVTRMEESPAVTVVVFDSANPEYFMAHWDLRARPGTSGGNSTWSDRAAPVSG